MKHYNIDLSKKDGDLFDEYIKIIKKLHHDMAKYIINSGIQKEKYNYLIKNIEKKSLEHIINVYHFLLNLKNNEFLEVKRAYNYIPEYVWENYSVLGVNDMPEHEHLEKCRKKVRERWVKRPKEKIKKNETHKDVS